ncbi:hypothetical protein GCM10023115_30870 [Pontixanthobacter gangjinensis]|uniref:DUF2255 family protein n=1 Tax=Christiangramia aestuarii TaxID=1028746 RepID=A0A7K1LND5_9FLAO|nr:DUF2255 family protein [Christiangramia aestuarii]MUP42319.1 DUF2255 family protein [Christiangramia aestuarii]
MFPKHLYEYLNTHTLIEVKGGTTRESFLPIWMVEVNGRLFSRSWNKSSRSWFTEFQKTGLGEIKYGNSIIKVRGKQLSAEDPLQPEISKAYLEKYDQPANLEYARGIAGEEYFDYTMEFLEL